MSNPEYLPYKPLIEAVAAKHSLGGPLVAAVCRTESNFRTDAFRHEPQFWRRYMAKNPVYKSLHPRRYSSSYGLMQPMWVVAVENGLDRTLPPEHLFVPDIGLEFGCRRLKRCVAWAQQFGASEKDTLISALAAYNGGANSSQAPPNPRNIKYALRVWQHLQELLA